MTTAPLLAPDGADPVAAGATPAPARLYTFRAEVYGVVDDVTYLRDPANRVTLSVPWDGERIGDERTVTVEVRPAEVIHG